MVPPGAGRNMQIYARACDYSCRMESTDIVFSALTMISGEALHYTTFKFERRLARMDQRWERIDWHAIVK